MIRFQSRISVFSGGKLNDEVLVSESMLTDGALERMER